MFSDDTGIDNMNNQCENPAEFRSCWVTKYVKKITIFDPSAMCLPIPLSVAFKYYLCRSKNAKKRDHPRQNRMLHQDAPAAHLQTEDFCGGGFLIGVYSKIQWNTRVGRNKKSIGKVYKQFSISIKSSWPCAFSYFTVMPVRALRVCWNWSSTASLKVNYLMRGKVIEIDQKMIWGRGLSISIKSSRAHDINHPIVVLDSTLRVRWNWSSAASFEVERSNEGQSNKN